MPFIIVLQPTNKQANNQAMQAFRLKQRAVGFAFAELCSLLIWFMQPERLCVDCHIFTQENEESQSHSVPFWLLSTTNCLCKSTNKRQDTSQNSRKLMKIVCSTSAANGV